MKALIRLMTTRSLRVMHIQSYLAPGSPERAASVCNNMETSFPCVSLHWNSLKCSTLTGEWSQDSRLPSNIFIQVWFKDFCIKRNYVELCGMRCRKLRSNPQDIFWKKKTNTPPVSCYKHDGSLGSQHTSYDKMHREFSSGVMSGFEI